jgi:DNA-binding response OmpR family regulator
MLSGRAEVPQAGELTLDRTHRNGRVEDRWLGLRPREFALLWRLAARPGEMGNADDLLAQSWPAAFEPVKCNVTAQMQKMGLKLVAVGLAQLIVTDLQGRYGLNVPQQSSPSDSATS